MKFYINGSAGVSPFLGLGEEACSIPEEGSRFARESDYKQVINPRQSRRMGKLLKMGVGSALVALKNAGLEKPDAVITGTGYGCLQDTEKFLGVMVENEETLLNPTAFILSTHNTVGGQIALFMGLTGYNFTYVHGAFSFENCLVDAQTFFHENPKAQVLVGGSDELTPTSLQVLEGLDCAPDQQFGEGAGFFSLSAEKTEKSYLAIEGYRVKFGTTNDESVKQMISDLLADCDKKEEEIDVVLSGTDIELAFPNAETIDFKQYTGVYPTAISGALLLAEKVLLGKASALIDKKGVERVLIVNTHSDEGASCMLVGKC